MYQASDRQHTPLASEASTRRLLEQHPSSAPALRDAHGKHCRHLYVAHNLSGTRIGLKSNLSKMDSAKA